MIFFGKIAGGIGGYFLLGWPGIIFGLIAGHMLDELIDSRLLLKKAETFFKDPENSSFPGRYLHLVSSAGTLGAFIDGPLSLEGIHGEIRGSFLTSMLNLRFRELQILKNLLGVYFTLPSGEKETCFSPFARILRFQGSYETRYSVCGVLFTLTGLSSPKIPPDAAQALETLASDLEIKRAHFQELRFTYMPEIRKEYEILGVPPGTDIRGIKKAYRRLVMEYHPDAHTKADEEETRRLEHEFTRIQEAYSHLLRSEKPFTPD
ncbi:MAG: DnaJ domain-containing protein [Spirochaetia bacterium]